MNSLKNSKRLFLIGMTWLVFACTTPNFYTHSDLAPGTDFNKYKTYSWISDQPLIQTQGGLIMSPLNAQRIQTEIEKNLNTRGYQLVALSDTPDFTVSFTVGTREKLNVYSYPDYYQRYDWRWPYSYHNDVRFHEYTEGTLAIDIFDYASGKPVWHGVTKKRIIEADISNPEPSIKKAVQAIIARLPK